MILINVRVWGISWETHFIEIWSQWTELVWAEIFDILSWKLQTQNVSIEKHQTRLLYEKAVLKMLIILTTVLMTLSIVLIDTYKVGKLLPDVGTYRCFLSLQVTFYNIINILHFIHRDYYYISFIEIMIHERWSLLGEIPRFSSNKVSNKSIRHFYLLQTFYFRYQPHNIESYSFKITSLGLM